jgi:hypothetical protein
LNEALVSSRLVEYEVWTRLHALGCDASRADRARDLVGGLELIELTPKVLARVLEPFPIALRTLEALHLATVEFLCRKAERVELASYDERLLAGARALGVPLYEL